MTADEINDLGPTLFGNGWKRKMADFLRVRLRKVQRWASGKETIPPFVAEELELLQDEQREGIGNYTDDADSIVT